ncbi:hypothetical protein L0B70_01400 [Kaistella sp. 97-N-M2]|uniref:hypothetical protein n=1 Tax=Kaistella sp. 97-N-M2 TaxID=2908645 RepID=UPI001F447BDF|nr:hypothetical protein [Kaistella sp. 97-N-M2]UJF30078.1 hypothetical protein L0B70_01400 [Kaistella sp. 97-N-M2]
MKGKTAVGCTNFKGCGFKVPFQVFEKKLTEKQILDLVIKGKSAKLKGFSDHPENLSEGILRLTGDSKIVLKKD